MNYSIEKHDKNVLIKMRDGKLNLTTSHKYKGIISNLVKEGFTNLTIDLSFVRFTDSTGLNLLLFSHRLCSENKGICTICGLGKNVKRLIEITKLESILNIIPNVQERLVSVDY